jgi:outer membrane protein W
MKKMMMTLGLTMLAGITSFAQEKEKSSGSMYTSLGPVGGFGHSWMSNMNTSQKFKPTANLGIGFIYSRFEHWGWGATLVASHEGYTTEYVSGGNLYTSTVDPTYLRLTPKAYYFFGSYTSNVRPKVYLGPSVGVKLQEDHYLTNETMNTSDAVMAANGGTEVYRTMDLGAEAGAGVNIKMARSTWLNLDASYYHGFTNATFTDNMNRNVRLNVGVMLGL